MTKIEIYARKNLADAVAKSKHIDHNIRYYLIMDWETGPELSDDFWNDKYNCLQRIINALEVLHPKEDHEKDLDACMPDWRTFASMVPA